MSCCVIRDIRTIVTTILDENRMIQTYTTNPKPHHAYNLNLLSMYLSLFYSILGYILHIIIKSNKSTSFIMASIALSYSIENIISFISGIAILYRFYHVNNMHTTEDSFTTKFGFVMVRVENDMHNFTIDDDVDEEDNDREKVTNILVSHLIIIMGIIILYTSSSDYHQILSSKEQIENVYKSILIIPISLTSIILFLLIGILKYKYGQLYSSSLLKDSYFDFISCIISSNIFITSMILLRMNDKDWMICVLLLHAFANGMIGLFCIFVGIYPLYIQNMNCCSGITFNALFHNFMPLSVVPYSDEYCMEDANLIFV